MTERIDPALRVPGIPALPGGPEGRGRGPGGTAQVESFRNVLDRTLAAGSLKFSRHAAERLSTSERAIGPGELEELERACARAEAKGARSTLVLMPGVAFVVAPQSKTVVTVIPEERLKENVFTSIDSAVIVGR